MMQFFVHRCQTRRTLALHRLIHLIGHLFCRSAFALRIRENMHFRKATLFRKLQSCLKILLGFSGEAHDNVRSNAHIRHLRTDLMQQLRKACSIVGAMHSLQNLVTAALQGQMQMLAQAWLCSHELQQTRLHLHGLQAAQAQAAHTLHAQGRFNCIIEGNVQAFLG